MTITLYNFPSCGPCRAVQMTAAHLGIDLIKKNVDLVKGEQMKSEFLKINPQHTVPTIEDDGFYLSESRAILAYLINKYAPGSPLYPSDPKERAAVDKMLYFDNGTFSKTLSEYTNPIVRGEKPDPEKEENLKKSLSILESALKNSAYVAGNHITVADYSIVSNMVYAEEVAGYSFHEFPMVSAWLEKMKKEIPNYKEINEIPIKEFKNFLKSRK
uniref:Glutathione transferase delta 2 n=1 Tax=Pardosa pseudoannulata TaxID=330961 RepID=A0A5Q0QNX1_9ARAC|nr:glutathione transferase delta 2 [Pardosa pseudoannulata]